MTAVAVFGLALVSVSAPLTTNQVLAAYQEARQYAPLTVLYPENDTVFPPEIVACTFSWRDDGGKSDNWLVLVGFGNDPRAYGLPQFPDGMDTHRRGMGVNQAALPGTPG